MDDLKYFLNKLFAIQGITEIIKLFERDSDFDQHIFLAVNCDQHAYFSVQHN